MKIFSSEPLQFIKNKLKQPDLPYDPDEESWPLGDDPVGDVTSLIKQKRFEKRD